MRGGDDNQGSHVYKARPRAANISFIFSSQLWAWDKKISPNIVFQQPENFHPRCDELVTCWVRDTARWCSLSGGDDVAEFKISSHVHISTVPPPPLCPLGWDYEITVIYSIFHWIIDSFRVLSSSAFFSIKAVSLGTTHASSKYSFFSVEDWFGKFKIVW